MTCPPIASNRSPGLEAALRSRCHGGGDHLPHASPIVTSAGYPIPENGYHSEAGGPDEASHRTNKALWDRVMKILFCGKTFPGSAQSLAELMPDHEILTCTAPEVPHVGLAVDVIVPLMHRLEPELIQGTAARLIQQWGVGLEGVDVAAATARGILVCNVPADETANADSTAEHAVFLMLGVARRVKDCFRNLREGGWGTPMGEALQGKTALIVGLGRVGTALAGKLKGLGMEVDAIRRTPEPEKEAALGLRRSGTTADLPDMAAQADFLISAVALTDETRDLFGGKVFHRMKPQGIVINVSRGPVVNEADLIKALTQREIGGAGLDVFSKEPVEPDNPLLAMDNVLATPHVAGVTTQTNAGISAIVRNNILLFAQGKTPRFCVNFPGNEGDSLRLA
jgi:phosphoglycerate dehydrogenase-like enzyme